MKLFSFVLLNNLKAAECCSEESVDRKEGLFQVYSLAVS